LIQAHAMIQLLGARYGSGSGAPEICCALIDGPCRLLGGAQLRFGDFQGNNADGNPQAITWADIRYLIVYFQSGNASGGNDFAVLSVRAVDDPAVENAGSPAVPNE
jgi:hypothetical protein